MKQNVNKSGLITKIKEPVWKIKVGVHSPISDENKNRKSEAKLWKIKVILN